jgi:hypothetical protein
MKPCIILELNCQPIVFFKLSQVVSNNLLVFFKGTSEAAIEFAKFIKAVLPYGPRAIKASEYSCKLFPPFFIDVFKEAENFEKSKLLVLTLIALFKCDYNCNAACDAF